MRSVTYGPGGYDPSKPNNNIINDEEIDEGPEARNTDTLQARLRQALQANRGYLAAANPTAAQTTAQVKALTRQVQAMTRLLLAELDGTD